MALLQPAQMLSKCGIPPHHMLATARNLSPTTRYVVAHPTKLAFERAERIASRDGHSPAPGAYMSPSALSTISRYM